MWYILNAAELMRHNFWMRSSQVGAASVETDMNGLSAWCPL